MLDHSVTAMEAAARHPLALTYAALAAERLGRHAEALAYLETALRYDPLNDLAACVRCLLCGENLAALLSTAEATCPRQHWTWPSTWQTQASMRKPCRC